MLQIVISPFIIKVVLLILAKAEICQARPLRLANLSAAKTRTTPYDAYANIRIVCLANDSVVRYRFLQVKIY